MLGVTLSHMSLVFFGFVLFFSGGVGRFLFLKEPFFQYGTTHFIVRFVNLFSKLFLFFFVFKIGPMLVVRVKI